MHDTIYTYTFTFLQHMHGIATMHTGYQSTSNMHDSSYIIYMHGLKCTYMDQQYWSRRPRSYNLGAESEKRCKNRTDPLSPFRFNVNVLLRLLPALLCI